jgi:hypothetical protein
MVRIGPVCTLLLTCSCIFYAVAVHHAAGQSSHLSDSNGSADITAEEHDFMRSLPVFELWHLAELCDLPAAGNHAQEDENRFGIPAMHAFDGLNNDLQPDKRRLLKEAIKELQLGDININVNTAYARHNNNPLSDMITIFVPLTTRYLAEFREQLFTSLRLFFPTVHLTLVLDEENQDDHATAELITKELQEACISHEIFFSPNTLLPGALRQQLIMHRADEYVTREYVGFVDTDAVFVTRVVVEKHLFAGTKPVIVAVIGMPQNDCWSNMPKVRVCACVCVCVCVSVCWDEACDCGGNRHAAE